MWLRAESPGDHAAIHARIEAAFANVEHASGTEARIVDALRAADAVTVSRAAGLDGQVACPPAFAVG